MSTRRDSFGPWALAWSAASCLLGCLSASGFDADAQHACETKDDCLEGFVCGPGGFCEAKGADESPEPEPAEALPDPPEPDAGEPSAPEPEPSTEPSPSPPEPDADEPSPAPPEPDADEPSPAPREPDPSEPSPAPPEPDAPEPSPAPSDADVSEPSPVPGEPDSSEPSPAPPEPDASEPSPEPPEPDSSDPSPAPPEPDVSEPEPPICEPSSTTCLDGQLATCQADGQGYELTACDDGKPCTADACQDGACMSAPLDAGAPCKGAQPCKLYLCDGAGACKPKADLLWNQVYANFGSDQLRGAAALADGTVVVVGNKFGKAWGTWLAHIAVTGEVLWEVDPATGGLSDVDPLEGGGYLVRADGGAFVLDDAGAVLWKFPTSFFGTEIDWSFVAEPASGEVAAVGRTLEDPKHGAFGRYTTDGDEVFLKSFDQPLGAIVATGDGGTVIGWQASPSGALKDIHLHAHDAGGATLWKASFDSGDADSTIVEIVVRPGLGFGFVANRGPNATPNVTDWWVVATDESGGFLWEDSVGLSGYFDIASSGAGTPDGGIVAGGKLIESAAGGTFSGLVRWDAWGHRLWTTNILPLGQLAQHVWALAMKPSGGYYAGGTLTGGAEEDVWLASLDAWGNATCAASGPCASWDLAECDDGDACTLDGCSAALGGCGSEGAEPFSMCSEVGACIDGECVE